MGSAEQTDVGAFASLVSQGVTYTANIMGSAGNSISIQITPGATAGAEVVSVIGNAISIQVESGVSTVTQVRTAVNAAPAAAALVTASGTSAATVATAAAAPLVGGDDSDFDTIGLASMSLSQIGTGLYLLSLQDPYVALIGASIMIQRASGPVDLVAQIASSDVSSAQEISFRMNAGATPTNLANGDILFIRMDLRNSSTNPV